MFKATWMWSYKDILNDQKTYIDFMKKNRITDLYLQFTRKTEYRPQYRDLIRELTKNGITVHATSGAPEWALDTSHIKSFLDAVHEYNNESQSDECFHHIHLDIEPYTLTEWKEDRSNTIDAWEKVVDFYTSYTDIPISVSIPFWLCDDECIFYDFMANNHDHLVIMSYRNTYTGSNGWEAIFEPNISYLENLIHPRSVVGAVETVPSSEGDHISFDSIDVDSMNKMLKTIEYTYYNRKEFKGVAIHDLKHWIELAVR